jgi:hypothetical protein
MFDDILYVLMLKSLAEEVWLRRSKEVKKKSCVPYKVSLRNFIERLNFCLYSYMLVTRLDTVSV